MVDNKFLPKLSQNLLEILDDGEYYDVTIEVGNDPYVKIFRAHMVILNYRSAYLRRILSTNKMKSGENLIQIKLPNILPEIFQIILRYIYGGRISLEEHDTSDIIKVLLAARELSLQELIPHLQSFLIQNNSTWMEQNFNLVYQASFENDSFSELQKYCTDLVSKEPDRIFNSLNISSISEKILITLIKSDNLQMSKVQVWEHVLRWGFAQNPELPSDHTKFSKNDFIILKNTLQQCIPFIKFYNLTSKEFLDNVLPYREILPEELYMDLLKTFLSLNPESKPNDKSKPHIIKEISSKSIDSKIITFQHVELISKWIDRLNITDKLTSSYEFKLLLRGSRDGFTPQKFREICDEKSHTVSIIKVKDSNEILGGYNPVKWIKYDATISNLFGSYGNTKDSFIFSFETNNSINSIKNYVLSRVIDKSRATYYYLPYGPSFGSQDLTIFGDNFNNCKKSWCRKISYEKPIRKTEEEFSVEEYEVYQIIKN